MKLILKYFKPYLLMAVVSIALLFAQQLLDLQLPQYMGNMVDTGIMRGGIEEPVPRALSADALAFVTSFMTEADAEIFTAVYSPEGGSTAELRKDFPSISNGDYVLKFSGDPLVRPGQIYGIAAVEISTRFGILTATENPGVAPDKLTNISKIAGVNAQAELYGKDLFSVQLPPDTEDPTKPFDPASVPPTMQTEIGSTLTRLFYRELGAEMNAIQQKTILKIGIIMLSITLGGMAITIGNGFLSAKISTGIGRNLRHDVFAKVQTYSPAEFDHFSTATLITRCTNDVSRVQQVAMMALRMILSAPIMGVSGVVKALQTSRDLSWTIAVTVILLLGMQFFMFSKVMPKFQIMQKLTDKLNLVTRESLTGMLVIRAFGNEAREIARFDEANGNIKNTNLYVQRIMQFMQPLMGLVNGLTSLTILFLGARLVDSGSLEVGKMMAFSQYVMMTVQAFTMIGMMFIMIPQSLVSARRIAEVLDKDTEIQDKPANEIRTLSGKAKGEVIFDNVTFKYPNAEASVLENISFTAKIGEMTAFIGSTGSGKSTLINLLPRFYDVTDGKITLDGVDIRDLSVIELRENIGYVPQKGILFSGDIASNLSFGKEDATDEQFRKAIEVAQAESFVYADKDGLATEIAQGGDNVSGGQRQRLSIARALVKNPPVYIFDDSFSALDYKTDSSLRRALRGYTNNATTLVVAQRISTIMYAQQIIVLDAGKIVGKGTHSELLKTCEAYREIAESQLSKEELA
ncbi:MAG: ABC transporter ATP-binding protein/permease [Oscillospiraceae bacterium]|nr:ABC transporter ATP-binding protein/permease [Oscillospiraceae bacterium]